MDSSRAQALLICEWQAGARSPDLRTSACLFVVFARCQINPEAVSLYFYYVASGSVVNSFSRAGWGNVDFNPPGLAFGTLPFPWSCSSCCQQPPRVHYRVASPWGGREFPFFLGMFLFPSSLGKDFFLLGRLLPAVSSRSQLTSSSLSQYLVLVF